MSHFIILREGKGILRFILDSEEDLNRKELISSVESEKDIVRQLEMIRRSESCGVGKVSRN
jgi:hypothetical protein